MAVTDCRSTEGTTVGLIDAIISIARIAARRDLTSEPARQALADLRSDEDVAALLAPTPSCAKSDLDLAFPVRLTVGRAVTASVYVHTSYEGAIARNTCFGTDVTVDQSGSGPVGVEVIGATRVDIDGVTVYPRS